MHSDNVVRLNLDFDPAALLVDLECLEGVDRAPQPYDPGVHSGLSLIAPGGKADVSSSLPSSEAPRSTPLLERTPYLRQVLDSLPCPKGNARIMYMAAGATLGVHTDPPCTFRSGIVRIHVPLRTHPDVILTLDDRPYHWAAGEVWWGNFARPHGVANRSPVNRAHLIVDAFITSELLKLFPPDFISRRQGEGILFHQPPISLSREQLEEYECHFDLPTGFVPAAYDRGEIQRYAGRASIRLVDGVLVLFVANARAIELFPVANGRLCLHGEGPRCTIAVERRRGAGIGPVVTITTCAAEDPRAEDPPAPRSVVLGGLNA